MHGPVDDVSDTVLAEAACDAEVIDRVAFDMRPGPHEEESRRAANEEKPMRLG